jgi:hypothetical protein
MSLVAAREVQRPGFALDRTGALTSGTGVFGAEGLGLLFQEGIQGALDQATGRLQGQVLQDGEVDVGPWTFRPESAPGDDFAPLGGQLTDVPDVFRAGMSAVHGLTSVALASWSRDELRFPF